MAKEGETYVATFEQDMFLQGGEYLLSMSCTGYRAVSYTHLDVYKRQMKELALLLDDVLIHPAVAGEIKQLILGTGNEKKLDVYKRQAYGNLWMPYEEKRNFKEKYHCSNRYDQSWLQSDGRAGRHPRRENQGRRQICP